MSDDEATRPHPGRQFGRAPRWLRRGQRRGVDAATASDDRAGEQRRSAEAGGPHGAQPEPATLRLRALEQPHPNLGRALDARTGSRRAPGSGGGSEKARDPSALALRSVSSPLDPPRSVVCASDSDRSRTPARPAIREREARCADGRSQREGTHRASARRSLGPLRCLEGPDPGLNRVVLGSLLAFVASLVFVAHAGADTRKPPPPTFKLGYFSQQVDRSRARIGGSIDVRRSAPERDRQAASRSTSQIARTPPKGGAVDDLPDVDPYPPLRADSTFALNSRPLGPDSFWYPVSPGRVCIYAPDSVLPCYTLVGPGGPGFDPGAIAASVADRLPLLPGRIQTSPHVAGLTGTDSWFWLDPAPRTEELTVSLAGERVTVRAEPAAIEWRFGDGAELAGGPGRPYRAGPPSAGAVLHLYETRCLPGDQGRNPYVLGSCGPSGYGVEAVVAWRISFSASGAVEASGTLPTRTTATSIAYPVSEARGFLVAGASR
jgi:hypothetical protein